MRCPKHLWSRVSCSKHDLRGVIAPGARVLPKTAALELFDLMFGYDGEWSVTGDLRVEAHLHDHPRSRNSARSRRGRDLVFPLDWYRHGIYKLEPSW